MDQDKDPGSPLYNAHRPSDIISDFTEPINEEKARLMAEKHGIPIPTKNDQEIKESSDSSNLIDATERFVSPPIDSDDQVTPQ